MSWVLLAVSLLIVLRGITMPAGYVLAPTLLAAVFGLWFTPQLIILSQDPFVPQGGVFSVALLGLMSLIAIFIGWQYGVSKPPKRQEDQSIRFNADALMLPVFLLTLFALGMNILLNRMSAQMVDISQWYGPIVIVAFFAQLRIVSLVLSLLILLRRRTPMTWTLFLLNFLMTVQVAFFSLRRSEMIDLIIVILGALWFAKRIKIVLPVILMGGMAMSIVIFSIGSLRGAQADYFDQTGQRVSVFNPALWEDINVTETIIEELEKGFDLRNAVFSTQYVKDTGNYSYGAEVWNGLVFQYLPAQLVGAETKRSFMIGNRGGVVNDSALRSDYGHRFKRGTTSTGIGSAYREFGYLGFVFFLFIAYFLARLYVLAIAGSPWMQAAYLCLLPFALTSITHGHDLFFVRLPLFLTVLFLMSVIGDWVARKKYGGHPQYA